MLIEYYMLIKSFKEQFKGYKEGLKGLKNLPSNGRRNYNDWISSVDALQQQQSSLGVKITDPVKGQQVAIGRYMQRNNIRKT